MWLLFTTLKVSKESFGLNFFFWATNYGIFFSNFCKKLNEYHATEEEEPLSIWPRQLHYIRFRFKLSMLLLRYIRNTSAHIWNLFIKRRSLVAKSFFSDCIVSIVVYCLLNLNFLRWGTQVIGTAVVVVEVVVIYFLKWYRLLL